LKAASTEQIGVLIAAMTGIAEIVDEYEFEIEQICIFSPFNEIAMNCSVRLLLTRLISLEAEYTYTRVKKYHYWFSPWKGQFFRKNGREKECVGTEVLFQLLNISLGSSSSSLARLEIIDQQLALATLHLPISSVLHFPWSLSRNYGIKLKAEQIGKSNYKFILGVDWKSRLLPNDNIVFVSPYCVAYSQQVLLTND
jgi:hypothetical protein